MYNAANRAVSFTSRNGNTIIECGYDYQGRRYMKKVTQNGTVASHERYLYRGYLQIAALDMLDNRNVLRTLLWDPLEPVATRPLALVQGASLYCYGVDFNKNVSEVFDAQGTIAAAYDYSPYGAVTGTGSLVQPVQWSGEMHDEELALVYYNYRYYNLKDGRWINRDPIAEQGGWNLYAFLGNSLNIDNLGLSSNDGSGIIIPNTETEGNCIENACGTTKPLSPDPEKIPKNLDLNTFLDVIREILIGDCTRMEKNSTQNETQCQECEREIICLAYFYHEAEQIGIEVHCVGRTIPLGIPKQLPPFESKLGLDGNRVIGITNIQNHMIKYIINPGIDKIFRKDGKILGKWGTYCCKEQK